MKGDPKPEEASSRGVEGQPQPQPQPQPYYGTFQGNPNYSHQTVIGIPQPVPPPGAPGSEPHYAHGYQAVPGYPSYETYQPREQRERRLPCCGLGIGWALFIFGFILATIPWYVGAILLLCVRRNDYREKPGLLACTIAAILSAIAIVLGATKGADDW